MTAQNLDNKALRLFVLLGGFFVANALLAELIGVKIFSLEQSLGLPPADFQLLGIDHLAFNLTTGVLLWPVVFVMTDIINEYYGKRGVKFLSYLTVALVLYAFAMVYAAIELVPADFWPRSHISADLPAAEQASMAAEVGNLNSAFRLIFGQGLWIIAGSLVAFLIGQIVDVTVFHRVKQLTGERMIWLRATGSTLVSQFIDSFVVLFIAFYVGAGWDLSLVIAIGLVNYTYKLVVAIAMTPLLYLAHGVIDRYLGEPLASKMKDDALADD
ncbi:queuosine precursor transporter [Spongiibacter taiwanensis]|uniref:queuosine precursor transporter n=1 Tax=Spongiibacter taiwanensis TaxID=1748242 RepID=UPI002036636B|nr:queuosine precursor transporter [Spongiibacter taiwanensis]USA42730.1 queuosine precursor transporter [Spongiibacter taiwanensis]